MRIEVTAPSAPAFQVLRGLDEVARFRCDVEFTAVATGSGSAVWDGVTFITYGGTDWTVAVDSVDYAESDVGGVWERDSIDRTAVVRTSWFFEGGAPFRIRAKFHFRPSGQNVRRTTEATFTCGPQPSAFGPPEFTLIEARTSDGTPEAGDTLFVRYAATAPARLLRSAILIRGAFADAAWIPEPLSTATERTLSFVIPRRVPPDSIVRIEYLVEDGAGRRITGAVATSLRVQDVRPPTLTSVTTFATNRATTTEVTFFVRASDDSDLHRIVWEVGGAAPSTDSVTIGDEELDHTQPIDIWIPANWGGGASPPITWRVRDRAGLTSNAIVTPAGAFNVYPTVSGAVSQGSFGMPGGAVGHIGDVVYDAKRDRLLTAHPFQGYLGIMDLGTMTALPAVQIPGGALSLALSPGGDSVLIGQATHPHIPLVDLATLARLTPIAVPLLDSIGSSSTEVRPRPVGLRVLANGTVLMRTHAASAAGHNLLTMDLATGAARLRPDAGPGSLWVDAWWFRLATSLDRSRAMMFDPLCARVYRAATDDFSFCAVGVPTPHTGIGVSADGQRIAAGGRILDADLATLATMGEFRYAVPLTDGLHYIATVDGTVQTFRIADDRPVARLVVGNVGLDRLMLLPDGHTVLAFAAGAGTVFKIDGSGLIP